MTDWEKVYKERKAAASAAPTTPAPAGPVEEAPSNGKTDWFAKHTERLVEGGEGRDFSLTSAPRRFAKPAYREILNAPEYLSMQLGYAGEKVSDKLGFDLGSKFFKAQQETSEREIAERTKRLPSEGIAGHVGAFAGGMIPIAAQMAAGGAVMSRLALPQVARLLPQGGSAAAGLLRLAEIVKTGKGASGIAGRVGAGMTGSLPLDAVQALHPDYSMSGMVKYFTPEEVGKDAGLGQKALGLVHNVAAKANESYLTRLLFESLGGGAIQAGLEVAMAGGRRLKNSDWFSNKKVAADETTKLAEHQSALEPPAPPAEAPVPRPVDIAPQFMDVPAPAPRGAAGWREPPVVKPLEEKLAETLAPMPPEAPIRLPEPSIPVLPPGPRGRFWKAGEVPINAQRPRPAVERVSAPLEEVDPFAKLAEAPATVKVPQAGVGQGGSTATAARIAQERVGQTEFMRQVAADLEARVAKGADPTDEPTQMAAFETVARRIASEPEVPVAPVRAAYDPALNKKPKPVEVPVREEPASALTPEVKAKLDAGEEVDLGFGPIKRVSTDADVEAGSLKGVAEQADEQMARQEAARVARTLREKVLSETPEAPAVRPEEPAVRPEAPVSSEPKVSIVKRGDPLHDGGDTRVYKVETPHGTATITRMGPISGDTTPWWHVRYPGEDWTYSGGETKAETVSLVAKGLEDRAAGGLPKQGKPGGAPVQPKAEEPPVKWGKGGQGQLLSAGGLEAVGLGLQTSDDPERQKLGRDLALAGAGVAGAGLIGASIRSAKKTGLVQRLASRAKVSPEEVAASGGSATHAVAAKLAQVTAAERLGQKALPALDVLEQGKNRQVLGVRKANLYGARHEVKVAEAVRGGVEEAKDAINLPEVAKGAGWYRGDLKEMAAELRKVYPWFKDKQKQKFVKLIAALTSAENAPVENIRMAAQIVHRWQFGEQAGELSALAGGVLRTKSSKVINEKLQTIQNSLNGFIKANGGDVDKGLKAFNDHLLEPITVSGRPMYRVKHFLTAKSNPEARKTPSFYLNLIGQTDQVTVDVWAVRWLRRQLGYVVDQSKRVKNKAGEWVNVEARSLNGSPSMKEYDVGFEAMTKIAKELEKDPEFMAKWKAESGLDVVDPMDVQALLWYHEKDLYERAGARDSGKEGFGLAARKVREAPPEFAEPARLNPKTGKPYPRQDLKLAEVPVGKRGARLAAPLKQRVEQVDRLIADVPEEFERRAWRLAKEAGISKEKFSTLTKNAKRQLLIDSKYGALSGEMGGAIAGAGLGAVSGDEDDTTGERLAKIGLGAAAGAIGMRALKGTPSPNAEELRALGREEQRVMQRPKDTAGAPTVGGVKQDSYEQGLIKGTIGAAKDEELTLTEAWLRKDPTGQRWAEEAAKLAKRRRISDEVVKEYSHFMDPSAKIARNSADLEGFAEIANVNRRAAEQISKEIDQIHLEAAYEGKFSSAQKIKITELNNKLAYHERSTLAALHAGQTGLSEAGRMLRYSRYMANNINDAKFWERLLKRRMGFPEGFDLPASVGDKLQSLMTNVDAAGKLTKEAQIELGKLVVENTPLSGPGKMILDLRKAGLLTLPATWVANIAGNLGKIGIDYVIGKPVEVFYDKLLNRITGSEVRSVTASRAQLKAGAKASYESLADIARPVAKTFRDAEGYANKFREAGKRLVDELSWVEDIEFLKKLDAHQVNYGDSLAGRMASTYTKFIYGNLDKQDKLFRKGVIASVMREQGELSAMRKGLKGAEAEAHIKQFLSGDVDPTVFADAIVTAELASRHAVFQEANKFAEGVAKLKSAGLAGDLTDLFVPFVRTPTNIVKQVAWDYNPVVAAGYLAKAMKKGEAGLKGSEIAARRELVQRLAKGTIGGAALLAGATLFDADMLSPSHGFTPEEASVMKTRNIGPNALKIGDDERVNVSRFGVLGMLLAMGADLKNAIEHGSVAGALAAPLSVAGELPMIKGATALADFVGAGGQGGGVSLERGLNRAIGTTAGSFIPSLVGGIARGSDEVARRKPSKPSEFLKERSGFGRSEVPASRSALGDAEKGRGYLMELFLPGIRVEKKDPIVREVTKLGLGLTDLPKDKKSGETDAQYQARLKAISPEVKMDLYDLFADPDYTLADKEEKRKKFRQALSRSRKQRTNEYLNR